jgi:acyl carrier protein
MEPKHRIVTFLSPFLQGRSLGEDEDIFASGVISSLFAMELVVFVEQEFEITLKKEDLDFENFRSIEAIARLVDRKLNGAGSS